MKEAKKTKEINKVKESLKIENLSDEAKLTPDKIVAELDRYIIGQSGAKRAVAIALRNRWRRSMVSDELRREIKPKNILFIGPTGSGKTEIARRLADFVEAPFIKVEATKFTEVGYVGRDVESIIRDLVETAVKKTREQEKIKIKDRAFESAVEKILDVLLPMPKGNFFNEVNKPQESEGSAREVFRKRILDGSMDDKDIEIEIAQPTVGVEIMAPPGMEEMTNQLQSMFSSISGGRTKKKN